MFSSVGSDRRYSCVPATTATTQTGSISPPRTQIQATTRSFPLFWFHPFLCVMQTALHSLFI